MRETEITYELYEPLEEVLLNLEKQGYKKTDQFEMIDRYFSHLPTSSIGNISFRTVIKNSFLLRKIVETDYEETNLVYKNKEFDINGNIISEEKIKVPIENFEKALEVFKASNFKPWASLNSINMVYSNGEKEFAIQTVEGLGLFMEIEEFEYMKDMTSEQKIKELEKFADTLNIEKSQSSNIKKLELYIERILLNQSKEL